MNQNNQLIVFDFDQEFFEANPSMTLFFDKNPKDKNQSLYFWCVAMIAAPGSPIVNFTEKEQIIEIKNFIDKRLPNNKHDKTPFIFDISNDLTKKDIDRLVDITTPVWKKLFIKAQKKLEERQEFMDSKNYDDNSWEMLDDMGAKSVKLWMDLDRIKKLMAEESDQNVQGGDEESFLEMYG